MNIREVLILINMKFGWHNKVVSNGKNMLEIKNKKSNS